VAQRGLVGDAQEQTVTLVSKTFVTRDGCADADEARARVRELGTALDARYQRGELRGYESYVVASDDDYTDYDLEYVRPLVEAITHGALPFIWLNITVSSLTGDLVAEEVKRFGLTSLATEELG
jgi:hypothetical protein